VQSKYKKRRVVSKLDKVNLPFYVYCLYFSQSKENDEYIENNVFYVGKAKNQIFNCFRRENEHMEEAYQIKYWNYHKSRKIRLLEADGKFIMSKVLEEFDIEMLAYQSELKWFEYFKSKGIDMTNMVDCGLMSLGSGKNHPSFDHEIRKKSNDIKNLYVDQLWSIQKIAKTFNKSSNVIKKILSEENVKIRKKTIRHPIWLKADEILEKYNSGYSLNMLTKEYDASMNFFSNMLKDLGCKIRKTDTYKRANAWNYTEEIINLYKNGTKMKNLCKNYKSDPCVIRKILKENGVYK
jgi:hypothetical protein